MYLIIKFHVLANFIINALKISKMVHLSRNYGTALVTETMLKTVFNNIQIQEDHDSPISLT